MIVVDTSVWIAHFRGERSPAADALRDADAHDIVVGDLILLECLQGAHDEKHAAKLEAALRVFTLAPMLNDTLAVEAARYFRQLRGLGVTPRKTIDMIIATFCIRQNCLLLHQDRDFDAMTQHLGLRALV